MSQPVDVVMRFKDAAEAFGYKFVYGTNSVLNLIDAEPESIVPEEVYLLLLPVTRRPIPGNYGGLNGYVHNCRFMLLAQNQFDHMTDGEPEDYYLQKYENRVLPMLAKWNLLRQAYTCAGIVMADVVIDEAINQFASNLDGIMVTCNIRIDVGQYNAVPIVAPIPPNESDYV